MEKLTLQEAIDKARAIAYDTTPKATFILDHIVKINPDYLVMSYSYLRWVDDVVDDPKVPITEKKEFIGRQKDFVKSCWNNYEVEPQCDNEYYIYYFIKYSLRNDLAKLVESVYDMVDTISWDVDRLSKDGVFSKERLENYIKIQSKAIHSILYYFLTGNNPREYKHENLGLSTANTKMFMLRDLKEDIDAGFINISREDVEKYSLNVQNLIKDENLSLWIKDQIDLLLVTLNNEISKLKELLTKGKLFHYYTCIYYLPKIDRYRVYGYYVGSSDKRSFLKELHTYWKSALFSLRLLKRMYIN